MVVMTQFQLFNFLLVLALSAPILAKTVCNSGELAVGLTNTCAFGSKWVRSNCHAKPTLWSDTCIAIDKAQNDNVELCEEDPNNWDEKSKISCAPEEKDKIWHVELAGGERFGSSLGNNNQGCYKVHDTYCGDFDSQNFGSVEWCCPRVPAPPPPAPLSRRAGPIKFMVVGDSITNGMEGDWTWRWRVYAWLSANGYQVEFVGPEKGTSGLAASASARPSPPPLPGQSNPAAGQTIGGYNRGVATSFVGSGHASYWGRQAAQDIVPIEDWVQLYQPDYLLLLVGFNDLGWKASTAGVLIQDMESLIRNARSGKSDVKILLGNVVHRTFISGREDLIQKTNEYNILVRDLPARLGQPVSPISNVDVNTIYNCRPENCPDGYDGLHPNAMGEYHIAQAFARVLRANFGFGGADFSVPAQAEPRTLSVPTGVSAVTVPEGIYLGWNRVETARGYVVRARRTGSANWESEGPPTPNTNAVYYTSVAEGSKWEYQVQATGDGNDKSGWSGITSATVRLQTAPGPSNVVGSPRPNGIQVTWSAVTGYSVYRYEVRLWDGDTPGAFVAAYGADGTTFIMDGLPLLHTFVISVATWVNLPGGPAGGPTSSVISVTVGGRPSPPGGIAVFEYNALDIQLAWNAVPGAQGYHVYRRPITNDGDGTFARVATTVYFTWVKIEGLFPGIWYYEFCVSAYNGDQESDHPSCLKPAVYPGWLPPPPQSVAVFEYDATTIQLGWPLAPGAVGYHVYRRVITPNNNGAFTRAASTTYWHWIKIENLFPGAWYYEFCIASWAPNYETESAHSTCIKPPVYPGNRKAVGGGNSTALSPSLNITVVDPSSLPPQSNSTILTKIVMSSFLHKSTLVPSEFLPQTSETLSAKSRSSITSKGSKILTSLSRTATKSTRSSTIPLLSLNTTMVTSRVATLPSARKTTLSMNGTAAHSSTTIPLTHNTAVANPNMVSNTELRAMTKPIR